MKLRRKHVNAGIIGRPPHGGRGLKLVRVACKKLLDRRPPHGGRGMKFVRVACKKLLDRRPPHGGRGLK